jgi:hypothetical protein
LAAGRIWEQIITRFAAMNDPELFGQLAFIYNGYRPLFSWMRSQAIWDRVSVPLVSDDGMHEWARLSGLGQLAIASLPATRGMTQSFELRSADSRRIDSYEGITSWLPENVQGSARFLLTDITTSMATLVIANGTPHLELRPPIDPTKSPRESVFHEMFDLLRALPYGHELSEYLSVHSPCPCVNRCHPLVRSALQNRYAEEPTDIQKFAHSFILCSVHQQTIDYLGDFGPTIKRWWKQIGCYFTLIDWGNVTSELSPPYRLRSMDGETREVTDADFRRWATATMQDRD